MLAGASVSDLMDSVSEVRVRIGVRISTPSWDKSKPGLLLIKWFYSSFKLVVRIFSPSWDKYKPQV